MFMRRSTQGKLFIIILTNDIPTKERLFLSIHCKVVLFSFTDRIEYTPHLRRLPIHSLTLFISAFYPQYSFQYKTSSI